MKKAAKKFFTFLSKIKFFRKHGFFRSWYLGHVLGDSVQRGVAASYFDWMFILSRKFFFWRYAPKKYFGGALLNLLGLSIFRYFFYNLRYRIRLRRGLIATEIRSKGGVVVMRGFLTQKSIDKILDFYTKNRINSANYFPDFSELVILNTKGCAKGDPAFEDLATYLIKECHIGALASDLTGLKLAINPFISILHYKSYVDQVKQCDGQDTPHSDVFYPSFKLFVYLNNVNEENGAFRYLVNSEQFNFKGAINAYKSSLAYYFRGGRFSLYPTDDSIGLSGQELEWLPATGRAGDAVIFNVQGVHRRGNFSKDRYRERLVLLVDFRQMEVPIQRFAANV